MEKISIVSKAYTLENQQELIEIWNLGIERTHNYLDFYSAEPVGRVPTGAADLLTRGTKYLSGPHQRPLNIYNCYDGVIQTGFGVTGVVLIYPDKLARYPYHIGFSAAKTTGVALHSDESSSVPQFQHYQQCIQIVEDLAHCTRTLWVYNLNTGRHGHLCTEHYRCWWQWMRETGLMSPDFIAKLEQGGKIDWPEALLDEAQFDKFREAGPQKYNHLRLTIRSPPPELCEGFIENNGMQAVVVRFLARSPHAGPLGVKYSKAYRHILFETEPDVDGCYISDRKTGKAKRDPIAPGEFERRLQDLRLEVHKLLATTQALSCDDIKEVQRRLMDKIPQFETNFTTAKQAARGKKGHGVTQPLVMMGGSSHRNFVVRFLRMVFTQPTVDAMRATLWGEAVREVGPLYEPVARGPDSPGVSEGVSTDQKRRRLNGHIASIQNQ